MRATDDLDRKRTHERALLRHARDARERKVAAARQDHLAFRTYLDALGSVATRCAASYRGVVNLDVAKLATRTGADRLPYDLRFILLTATADVIRAANVRAFGSPDDGVPWMLPAGVETTLELAKDALRTRGPDVIPMQLEPVRVSASPLTINALTDLSDAPILSHTLRSPQTNNLKQRAHVMQMEMSITLRPDVAAFEAVIDMFVAKIGSLMMALASGADTPRPAVMTPAVAAQRSEAQMSVAAPAAVAQPAALMPAPPMASTTPKVPRVRRTREQIAADEAAKASAANGQAAMTWDLETPVAVAPPPASVPPTREALMDAVAKRIESEGFRSHMRPKMLELGVATLSAVTDATLPLMLTHVLAFPAAA